MNIRELPLVIYSPIYFYKTLSKKEASFLISFSVFFTFLVFIVVTQYLIFTKLIGSLPSSLDWARNMQIFGFTFNLFIVAIAEILFWILGTGILACVAILLDGEGEYRKLLELTGYSHLPLLLFSLFAFTFSFFYYPQIQFSRDYSEFKENIPIEKKEKLVEELKRDMETEIGDWRFRLLGALRQCFHIWTGICCAFALKFSFRISYFKSFMALLGLTVFYIILEILRNTLTKY